MLEELGHPILIGVSWALSYHVDHLEPLVRLKGNISPPKLLSFTSWVASLIGRTHELLSLTVLVNFYTIRDNSRVINVAPLIAIPVLGRTTCPFKALRNFMNLVALGSVL